MSSDAADDGTHPDIPDQQWENPFTPGTYLHDLYGTAVRQERDVVMILDDYRVRRGTGKTIASLQLANGMDRTVAGLIWGKVTLKPELFHNAYVGQPIGSGLVLDEAEYGASNRDPMSNVNKELRKVMSMGRVKQKYVVVNAPARGFIDTDIQKLADCWISMVRRGKALVHDLRWEPYSEQLLTPKVQTIEFENIPAGSHLRSVYNRLTREKNQILDSDEEGAFVTAAEHQEALKQARKQARREQRNEIIRGLFAHPDIQELVDERRFTQTAVAESIGIDQGTVSRVLSTGDDAEE